MKTIEFIAYAIIAAMWLGLTAYSLWWIIFSKEGIIELWKNDKSE